MEDSRKAWILLADSAKARLIECERVAMGRCHVQEKEALRATPLGHEHGRPTLTSSDGHSGSPGEHEGDEQMHRFARALADWIPPKVKEHGIEKLALFAPPKFLGALRRLGLPRQVQGLTEWHGELSSMDAPTLARHPAIMALVPHKAHETPA